MQGHLDSELTADGLAQAAAVAPGIAAARAGPADQLRPAPRRRHRRAWSGRPRGLDVKVDPRLRETHLGRVAGAHRRRDRGGVARRHRGRGAPTPPGRRPAASRASRWCAAARPSIDELDEEYADDARGHRRGRGARRHDRRPGVRPARPAHLDVAVDRRDGQLPLGRARAPRDHPRWRLSGYNVGYDAEPYGRRVPRCWSSPTRWPSTGPSAPNPPTTRGCGPTSPPPRSAGGPSWSPGSAGRPATPGRR